MKFIKAVLVAAAILALTALEGCVLAAIDKAKSIEDLSVPQIKALREANMDVYACLTVGGPPPGGNLSVIVVPKDVAFKNFAFLPNCSVDMR